MNNNRQVIYAFNESMSDYIIVLQPKDENRISSCLSSLWNNQYCLCLHRRDLGAAPNTVGGLDSPLGVKKQVSEVRTMIWALLGVCIFLCNIKI